MNPFPPPPSHGGDGALVGAALGLRPEEVLDLSQSLNPVAPDLGAILGAHLRWIGRYPDAQDATRALAEAMGVDVASLLLTNGGAEAIALVAAELGGHVVEPEFSLHPRGTSAEGGPRWRSNPHNPTGLLAGPTESAGVWDEAFFALATGTWTRGDPGAVVVGSLTKLLACPGLRIGYVLADPDLVERCRRRQPEWSVNALVAGALGDLLQLVDLGGWAAAVRDLRWQLVEVLRHHGLEPLPSDANWVLVEAPGLRMRLAPFGVVVRDCTSFGLPRIARVAVPSCDGLERLDRALDRALCAHTPATDKRQTVERQTVERQTVERQTVERQSDIKSTQSTPSEERGAGMESSSFEMACASVLEVDARSAAAAAEHHDRLTKPRGSLGRLEATGVKLCAIARTCPPPVPEPVTVAVFAADHGVVAEGVTPWPQEVTAQMVANFCEGGAAINVLARHVGARVVVVDVGVGGEIPADAPGLLHRSVRRGTRNLATEPAMTAEEVTAALDVGADVAGYCVGEGARLLVTGDMGIGNTTAAAALIAALTASDAASVTGRGTGIDDEMLARKKAVVADALEMLPEAATPLEIMQHVGGLEISALAGFVVAGAAARVPVVVDGVIAAAAAVCAVTLAPDVAGYLIAGHRSSEPGATVALEHLGLVPVLDLGMRLGEGSGAVLAVPAVQAAAKILREMATFDSAGVTDKGDARL